MHYGALNNNIGLVKPVRYGVLKAYVVNLRRREPNASQLIKLPSLMEVAFTGPYIPVLENQILIRIIGRP